MKDHILIINTGGTFNKYYDPVEGALKVDTEGKALKALASHWLCEFEIINIIAKDSLEMTSQDRLELLATIHRSECDKILIVHGTDTVHLSAEYLADADIGKVIVFTGAMVPYAFNPTEATANFAMAYGFLVGTDREGVHIAMHGSVAPYNRIYKDRKEGCFKLRA